ncbi:hypothetical protein KJ365_08700 [Glaciecola sp. XM2]|jgi:type IV pilus biogenesis protein CpaD/CtpE|uniref:hypothetical protein n=1 Tax=Glaciecola sp. XM2 TaxID=1914931 RepID=UPI001BDE8DBA|nr:hypothetical protein [Glaciecola sp. XM2]MBT1450958.1 hypothetical protein [Glaciecola sp. XM2]
MHSKHKLRLLLVVMVASLSGCASIYEDGAIVKTTQPICIETIEDSRHCDIEARQAGTSAPHGEYRQQMLPIHLRDEVIEAELEDLRRKNK